MASYVSKSENTASEGWNRSLVVSDLRSETKMFPVLAWLLAMSRGELSAIIARLMSKCL